jgi:multicomponent K+:H+ antiporter subunit D
VSHWILVPIVLPMLVAALLVVTAQFDLWLARFLSLATCGVSVLVAGHLWLEAMGGEILSYNLGNWPAPYGIVLVLDRLSALMLVLTSLLAVVVALASLDGCDSAGRGFHPLLLFQLAGINGAFLTGDLFNLFVFFEVLLIASYGLAVHGGGGPRLRAGLQFVVVNLVGSTLFLVGIGLLYGVTGSLHWADMVQRASEAAEGDQALLRVAGLLLMVVFGLKAALLPFHFWLPGTYCAVHPVVAAMFAVTTKVGLYAIVRLGGLMGWGEPVSWLPLDWVWPLAAVGIVVGSLGVAGSRSLGQMVSHAVVASMGTALLAIGLGTGEALVAGLYYTLHSTLAAAAMFLMVGVISQMRQGPADLLTRGSGGGHWLTLIGGLFLLTSVAMVGLPPLSGFVGKLLVLRSAATNPWAVSIWAIVLVTAWVVLLGFVRAGSLLFWGAAPPEPARGKDSAARPLLDPKPATGLPVLTLVATSGLLVVLCLMTFFSDRVLGQLQLTVDQIADRQLYWRASMGLGEGESDG